MVVVAGSGGAVSAPIDTNLIRTIAIVWRYNGADGTADAIEALCDEVDRRPDPPAHCRWANNHMGDR